MPLVVAGALLAVAAIHPGWWAIPLVVWAAFLLLDTVIPPAE